MILRTIRYIKVSESAALIIIPQWKHSCFYPVFRDMTGTGIAKKMVVYDGRDMFSAGQDIRSYFGPEFAGNVEVWYLDYRN
jgi:hypothetical protein